MSVFFANKSNFIKLIFAIFLAIPISYINFNQLNFHGDYNFFKEVYNNFGIIFVPDQFTFIIKNVGVLIDPLLALIFFICQYIFSYELFMFIISVLLFYIFIDFIYVNKNHFLFFLLIISSYYVCTISAASPKNILIFIFFILSLKNFDNKKFYVFYICSFLIHSAASLIFFLTIIIFLKKNFYKILFDAKKLIILIIPILLSLPSIYDKIYGYNYNNTIFIEKSNDEFNNFIEKSNDEFNNEFNDKITEKIFIANLKKNIQIINIFIKKKYIFEVINLPMSFRSIFNSNPNIQFSDGNYNLAFSFSIYDLIKLSLIFFIIIVSSNSNYNIYLGIILTLIFVGLGFPRIYMFLHLLIIYLIIKSNINLKRLSFYSFIFFFYIIYFFLKNILFIITFYNTGYIYF